VLISTKEAAERLGVSTRRVQQMIEEGSLPATKLGRDYAILEKDLKKVKTYGKPGRPPKGSK
jgi:excisionase family DNA binding protein